MKVLFLPLDSRPCNRIFPVQLAAWSGAECVTPPPEIMDYYTTPSDSGAVIQFLKDHMAEADALILSVDQLCFGGLLASREMDVSISDAIDRLKAIQELHAAYPDKPIHAFSVIQRSSISTLSLSDISVYQAVTAYSEYSDRYSVTQLEQDRLRMEQARKSIPDEVLRRVQEVRRRNHRVNLRCLEWQKEGVFTSLLLLMEDSQAYGFHRKEQRILTQRMEGIREAYLHNGTDEGGCVTMAKALTKKRIPISVHWAGRPDGLFVAKYEDRPFIQNLQDNMDYLNLQEAEDAEIALVIAAPSNGIQGDGHEEDYQMPPETLSETVSAVQKQIREGKRVYLLDLICANGGVPDLLSGVDAGKLAGYSAWNTASNSMGTILAQIISDDIAGKPNIRFRNERFMDDMLYETIIRLSLNAELRAGGLDPYRLADKAETEKRINEAYRSLSEKPRFAGIFRAIREAGDSRLTLPWDRTFEAQAHNGD